MTLIALFFSSILPYGIGAKAHFHQLVPFESRRSPAGRLKSTKTATACFAASSRGGGFGVGASKKSRGPKNKTTSTKTKKRKSRSSGLLEELVEPNSSNKISSSYSSTSSASSTSAPNLDRFGLPIATEDDIFPPLASDVIRSPAHNGEFDKEEVANAIKNHLGVNLDAFDANGNSIHLEHCQIKSNGGGTQRWKLKLLHADPPVFQVENFFTREECKAYISMVDENAKEETEKTAVQVTSPTFSSPSYSISRRTSTTWFCRYKGVPTLLAKAKHLLGADLCQMEEPQIVRYRTGEEFSWHYDEIPSTQLSNGGQRLATLLVYLNDLDTGRGGGTIFRDLKSVNTIWGSGDSIQRENFTGQRKSKSKQRTSFSTSQLTVRPRTGSALLFFPSYKNGIPDIRTLHKGEVALDTKIIAQLWIHEKEYKAVIPEHNFQMDAVDRVSEEFRRLGFGCKQ